jgi:hypothetical protein
MAPSDRRNSDSILLAALAGGSTVVEAAQQAGVSERTAWRRLQDDDFRQRLDAARQRTVQRAVDVLSRGSTRAARTLVALLSSRQRATTRLAAARAILELGARMRDAEEVEARLTALEEALADRERRGHRGYR